jgi:SNF2 family DNA or RNA helicase
MDKKKSHAQKIANLVEALANLSGQDIDEAKIVLESAGKDPESILETGLKKLEELRVKYRRENSLNTSNAARRNNTLVLAKCPSDIIDLIPFSVANRVLNADDVYKTFVRHQQFDGISFGDLKISNSVNALTFSKLVRTIEFEITVGAEYADVRPLIASLTNSVKIGLDELDVACETGYLIQSSNWYPIDKESLIFSSEIRKSVDAELKMSLKDALYYFSKRHIYQWIHFHEEELSLKPILSSEKYSARSDLFVRNLYEYQNEGLQWLLYCCLNRIGGILADDMGLGKTAQIIALLSWIVERDFFKNNLIVAPSTLLENWRREFEFFTPTIAPYIHHGDGRTGSISELGRHKIVLTSYSMAINDRYLFDKIDWGLVVLDEASLIKNPDSERKSAVSNLSAEVRIAMTGTPVENSLTDLWSIGDFVNPGYFGTRQEFAKKYIRKNIETTLETSDLIALKKEASFIMLRRKKEDVLQMLPEKIDIHQALEMNPEEALTYESRREEILSLANNGASGIAFKLIQDLRQFTTHPLLGDSIELRASGLTAMQGASVKFSRTIEILDEIRSNGEKVLIFTEYLDMIDAFSRILSTHYGIEVFTIDGRVETQTRQLNIDRFSELPGFGIMVLNPRTAGMGLNITAANHVIHYTRQWNPALEEQATARAYRNRQTKGVNVYYLYYVNTIEEVIDVRLRSKQALSGEVISITEPELSMEQYLEYLSKSPIKK